MIVVIGDNANLRDIASRLLDVEGYPVQWVPTGHEGLDLIKAQRPQLVLLDACLPDGAGTQVLEQIRTYADLLRQSELTEKLRESEARYRAMMERLPDIVYINRNDCIIYVNPAGVRLLRADSEADILGRSPFDFIHPDFHDMVRGRIAKALEQPTVSPVAENCLIALDGTPIPVEIIASSYRSGEHMDIQVIARDIRLRKQVEGDRRVLLQMASDLAQLGAWAIELQEQPQLTWSTKVYEIHDVPDGAPLSVERAIDFYAPEDQATIRAAFSACVETGTPYDLELQIVTATGRRTWVRTIGQGVRDELGRVIRVQGAFQDISQRKAAEERERQLQQQLQQAQRMEAVGQLTGGVAHDFNNLLTVILGNAELLCEQLGPETRQGAIAGLMSAAAQRGAKLTNALLAFARRQALDPVPLDVNELLQSMHQLLQRTLSEAINIELRLAPGLPAAMVDPARLEGAVLNLCLNARDAMPGGGRLLIETSVCELGAAGTDTGPEFNPGNYLLLAVSDTGCGIAPEHQQKVFEPFFSTKGPGKGTGLGLPMVYGFLKQSGGQLTLYSEPGEGTTVKMYLPLASEAAVDRLSGPVAAAPMRGSERILLVEDDDMVRAYAARLVASFGYAVTTAASGPEALALLRQDDGFDLLFTDIVMSGGMDGRQLVEQAMVLHPQLKVLYTSGYTENAIVHNGRLDPGINLISKPYLPAELAARLRAVLDQSELV